MGEIFLNLIPTLLIFVVLWLLINYLTKKYKYFNNKKRIRILVVSITTLLCYLFVVSVLLFFMFQPKTENFDTNKWAHNEEVRYTMIDDIIDEQLLIGMGKNEVKNTLGEPSKVDTSANRWVYEILGQSVFEFMFIDLVITFENNKVIKVEKIEKH